MTIRVRVQDGGQMAVGDKPGLLRKRMVIIYDLFFLLFAVCYFPYVIFAGKMHAGFGVRLGLVSPEFRRALQRRRNIWFHAVSVGEVMAILPLIQEVKKAFPQNQVVLSTVTQTGYQVARQRLGPDSIVFYAPLDFSLIVRRLIRLVQPLIYLTAETEIWPNIFCALAAREVPVVVVNGRISDRSVRRYQKVKKLLRPALHAVTVFCMQTPSDAERLTSLGVASARVRVAGNMKFDFSAEPESCRREDLGIAATELLLLAGSTHPGEEDMLLNIYQQLKKDFPPLRLLLAPRHVERSAEVAALIKAAGLEVTFFSRRKEGSLAKEAVVLLDIIGQLRGLYRLADVVFVGKSLIGRGGQNIVEPAVFGKPVIVGPYMENFRNVMDMFRAAGAVVEIRSVEELRQQIRTLLAQPQQRRDLGQKAYQVVRQSQGALARHLQEIQQILS